MSSILDNIVRGHLQTASVEYKNSAFIAKEVYPAILMDSPQLKIPVFNRGDTFRDDARVRAPGTETPVSHLKASFVDLSTLQYGYVEQITKEELWSDGKVGYPKLDLKQRKIERIAKKLLLSLERVVAASVTTGTWADGNSGGEDTDAKWTASSGNTFLDDVDKAINVLRAGGVPPSHIRLMTDFKTFQGARIHGGVTAVTQYTRGALPSAKSIADFLGIADYIVGGAIYSSAAEKQDGTDFTSLDIWGGATTKGFGFVYYYPGPSLGLGDLCAGLSCYNKMENGQSIVNYESYDEKAHSYRYEGQHNVGAAQVAAACGYLFKDTHTT